MALFGGVSLIVPMLIMSLHPTLLTVLGTTLVIILVVGVALARFHDRRAEKRNLGRNGHVCCRPCGCLWERLAERVNVLGSSSSRRLLDFNLKS